MQPAMMLWVALWGKEPLSKNIILYHLNLIKCDFYCPFPSNFKNKIQKGYADCLSTRNWMFYHQIRAEKVRLDLLLSLSVLLMFIRDLCGSL